MSSNNLEANFGLSPSLAVFKSKLYLAYVNVNSTITITSMDANQTWSRPQVIPQVTKHSISLEEFQGNLYLVFVAEDQNNQLFLTWSPDGRAWRRNTPINAGSRITSKCGPSLAKFNDYLYVAYANDEGDFLYTYTDGVQWAPSLPFAPNQPTARHLPAGRVSIAAFNKRLFVAYAGERNPVVNWTADGVGWQSYYQLTGNGDNLILDPDVSAGVGLGEYNGKLYMSCVVEPSASDPSTVLCTISTDSGIDAQDWSQVPGYLKGQVANTTSAFAEYNGKLFMAYMSINTGDGLVYTMSDDGTTWNNPILKSSEVLRSKSGDNVYVANSTNQGIYAIAAEKKAWETIDEIATIAFDVVSFLSAAGDLYDLLTLDELIADVVEDAGKTLVAAKDIKNLDQVVEYLKSAYNTYHDLKEVWDTINAPKEIIPAAYKVFDDVKKLDDTLEKTHNRLSSFMNCLKIAIHIEPDAYADVLNTSLSDLLESPSGIASLTGTPTYNIWIGTQDQEKYVDVSTTQNASWVTTQNGAIQAENDGLWTPNTKTVGVFWHGIGNGTQINFNLSPSIATFNNRLYLAYVNVKNKIVITSMNVNQGWSIPVEMPQSTNQSPSLVKFHDSLYLAFVAEDSKNTLSLIQSTDGVNWNSNHILNSYSAKFGPSLAEFNDSLYLAYVSNQDGTLSYTRSKNGVTWDRALSFAPNPPESQQSQAGSVSIATFDKQLFMAYAGKSNPVVSRTTDGTNWEPYYQMTGTGTNLILDPDVSAGVSLGEYDNQLYMACVVGPSSSHLSPVLCTVSTPNGVDDRQWSQSPSYLNGQVANTTPALVQYNGKLFMVYVSLTEYGPALSYSTLDDGINWNASTLIAA